MSILTRLLTYNDLVATHDEFNRTVVIGGEMHASAAPIPEHQRLSGLLSADFFPRVEPSGRARVHAAPDDVVFGDDDMWSQTW